MPDKKSVGGLQDSCTDMIMKQAQVQASTMVTKKSQYSGEVKLGADRYTLSLYITWYIFKIFVIKNPNLM